MFVEFGSCYVWYVLGCDVDCQWFVVVVVLCVVGYMFLYGVGGGVGDYVGFGVFFCVGCGLVFCR